MSELDNVPLAIPRDFTQVHIEPTPHIRTLIHSIHDL
jgi:hypothetical protein